MQGIDGIEIPHRMRCIVRVSSYVSFSYDAAVKVQYSTVLNIRNSRDTSSRVSVTGFGLMSRAIVTQRTHRPITRYIRLTLV